jgi:small subunit ribosomal protein S5
MMYWTPKTRLGIMVEKGDIKTMTEALATRLPLREPEIVDILLPNLEDEVLDVNMVQRMTDSGRRVRFAVTTVVGNGNGYVGLGRAKGKEVGPTIRKAIDNAKLNIIEVKRGCGSWECGCNTPHTLPFTVSGKKGSVEVTFKPAPRGIALAVGDVTKPILKLAGISDAWAFTKGHTKTTTNYAAAAFEALKKTAEMRVTRNQEEDMHILTGAVPMAPGESQEGALIIESKEPEAQKAPVAETEKPEEKKEEAAPKEDGKKEPEGGEKK